jgi:hypothetical protein
VSEIVEVIEQRKGEAPRLKLRCAGCGHIYVTNTHKWNALRLKACFRCRDRGKKT